jgi:uncharacterized protein
MSRLFRSQTLRFVAVLLIALAWNIPAFCGEIHDAIQNGNLPKVQALLQDNPQLVSSKSEYGWTPLHWAAMEGHKVAAKLLLAKGADVNANAEDGSTPLHAAAGNGDDSIRSNVFLDNEETVELLLASKAQINAQDKYGQTPLHGAAMWGHMKVAEVLLTKGANVNIKDIKGQTPLHVAKQRGVIGKDVVKLLRRHRGHE